MDEIKKKELKQFENDFEKDKIKNSKCEMTIAGTLLML